MRHYDSAKTPERYELCIVRNNVPKNINVSKRLFLCLGLVFFLWLLSFYRSGGMGILWGHLWGRCFSLCLTQPVPMRHYNSARTPERHELQVMHGEKQRCIIKRAFSGKGKQNQGGLGKLGFGVRLYLRD